MTIPEGMTEEEVLAAIENETGTVQVLDDGLVPDRPVFPNTPVYLALETSLGPKTLALGPQHRVTIDSDFLAEARTADARRVEAFEGNQGFLFFETAADGRAEAVPAPTVDRWYHNNAEKVAWSWLALEDRVIEELG